MAAINMIKAILSMRVMLFVILSIFFSHDFSERCGEATKIFFINLRTFLVIPKGSMPLLGTVVTTTAKMLTA